MEAEKNSIPFTSADLSIVWNAFQNESLAVCGISHFLQHVKDHEIQALIEKALELSTRQKKAAEDILISNNIAVPRGLTEEDVHLDAPRLFTDKLYLEYLLNSSDLYHGQYATALSLAEHEQVISFVLKATEESKALYLETKELSKQKGTFRRAPSIPYPKQTDTVMKQNFLAGWFGVRRPLLGREISQIYYNAKRNAVGIALMTGFAQVTRSKEIEGYLERGKNISQKHIEIFTSILKDDDLSNDVAPHLSEVTESTYSPYSDRFIMNIIALLSGAGIAQYGMSIASSQRHDLGGHFTRLCAEIAHYAEDGLKLLIKNEWLEQPPIAADRDHLSNKG